MKIIAFADLHVGVKLYGKLDPETGLNTRELQTLQTLEEIVNYAMDNNIKVIAFAGDMYKNSMPSSTLQEEINKRIVKASKNGITVLMIDGNHDVSRMETNVSPLKPFSTFQIDNVYHTRFHAEVKLNDENGNPFKFVFLPTYHTKEQIEEICKNTVYDGAPIIFIGHLAMNNAMLNDWTIMEKETFIETETFNIKGCAAVILGHFHKHQILMRDPLVFYTGSTQRVDFNEERQPKGFVVLDVDKDGNTDYEYVEVESQKFCTLKFTFENEQNPKDAIIAEMKSNKARINKAIVRIQIEMDELTKITVQDEKEIYQSAYDLGAANILTISKKMNSDKALRNAELTEHVSIEKGLELYYEGKPRAAQRIKLGKQIIKQSGIGEL